jgi:hypothetical protein
VPEGSRACAFGACARSICRLHHEFALCTLRQPPGTGHPAPKARPPALPDARARRHGMHTIGRGREGGQAGARTTCERRAPASSSAGTAAPAWIVRIRTFRQLNALRGHTHPERNARCVVCCRRMVHRPLYVAWRHVRRSECSQKRWAAEASCCMRTRLSAARPPARRDAGTGSVQTRQAHG